MREICAVLPGQSRGVLADGIWNEDNSEEDFSPDFDFEAVPARLADGWSAEFRIPWASLGLPHPAPEKLTFIVFRNQPRDTRIRTTNVPLGRDPSCFLCVAEELDRACQSAQSVRADCHALRRSQFQPEQGGRHHDPRNEIQRRRRHQVAAEPGMVIDATLRPDFSQQSWTHRN